ncbi:MAG: radical SAM protein, partial [Verrucomicrobiota bacterium]|nr:radical SAM protein [Verrucomicrobiota bacterium]
MTISSLPRKIKRGIPYLRKEVRAIVSDHTPFFIALPRTVHLWRAAPCNAKCIMCDYGILKGEGYTKISRIVFPNDYIFKAVDQVAELSGRGTLISYMGGEPTVNPQVVEWVRRASSQGLDFRFTSNGYKIDQKLAAALVDAGMFNIGISLESIDPKINEILRPHPNGTQKTINAIEFMLAEREKQKKFVSVGIKTVLSNLNLEGFLDIVKRWGKTDGVMCTPQMFERNPNMSQEAKDMMSIKDVSRMERFVDNLRALKADGYAVHV